MAYIGRFAPSPTGPLHFGSLLAALASFLDAKSNQGLWLLRIEDLDPPREPVGAADEILQQLDKLQLNWDGEVLHQSSRLDAYQQALTQLADQSLCFHCLCTRSQIREMGAAYNGHCRNHTETPDEPAAIRIRTASDPISFTDRVFGEISQNIEREVGDFILKRKDGLFAYQLAVVVDDAHQEITHVVRGSDLLESTPRQVYLQKILNLSTPAYCHVPVIVDEHGQKLSKQQFAEPVNSKNGNALIYHALKLLGQNPETGLCQESVSVILKWAIEHWDIQAVPKLANMPMMPLN